METMTTEQIDEIAERAARAAIASFIRHNDGTCKLCDDKEYWANHEAQHQFLTELIATLKRLQEIKWSTYKSIVAVLGIGFVAFILLTFFGIKLP